MSEKELKKKNCLKENNRKHACAQANCASPLRRLLSSLTGDVMILFWTGWPHHLMEAAGFHRPSKAHKVSVTGDQTVASVRFGRSTGPPRRQSVTRWVTGTFDSEPAAGTVKVPLGARSWSSAPSSKMSLIFGVFVTSVSWVWSCYWSAVNSRSISWLERWFSQIYVASVSAFKLRSMVHHLTTELKPLKWFRTANVMRQTDTTVIWDHWSVWLLIYF